SQPSGRYHAVPPPTTRTFMPSKTNLVFHTAPIAVETDHSAFTVQLSSSKPAQYLSHTNRPTAPIIKDWPVEQSIPGATPKPTRLKSNSSAKRKNGNTCFNASLTYKHPLKHMVPVVVLTQSKPVYITAVRPVSAVVPKIMVTRPRLAHQIVTKSKSPIRKPIANSQRPIIHLLELLLFRLQWLVLLRGNPQYALKDNGVVDSGCSRHMTGNMSYLFDFEELNGGYVTFGGNPKGGKISGKGKIKTGKLDFNDVYFVKELKFNIFSVSQMCDKKNSVLFTDIECLVLSSDFKLPDESQVLLRVPRENNISNNGTEFKNIDLNQFCGMKGIKREFSIPRTPQQNGIAKRKNRTLIEAARTMLAYSLLPIPFWAEVVNTTCYVQNRVLVTKPNNKIPYELLHGKTPSVGFMRPFGCLVTILNTLDSLVTAENRTNSSAGFQNKFDAVKAGDEINQQYVLFPVWSSGFTNPQNYDKDVAFDGKEHDFDTKKPEFEVILSPSSSAQSRKQDDKAKKGAKGKIPVNAAGTRVPTIGQNTSNSTNPFSATGPLNTTASPTHGQSSFINTSQLSDDLDMLELEDITYSVDENNVGAEA
nr:ribonuclease H-like domain-containing protein [Tanacetum cinerariifolium]